jgi:bifunctional non-homologous end joining protein LigD
MPKSAIEPCIPSRGKVPDRPEWIHEIKHDGYRLIVQRDGKRVRLFTKNGHDCTDRYPFIVEAASRIRSGSFVLDGEAVLLGADGISDFDGLLSAGTTPRCSFTLSSARARRRRSAATSVAPSKEPPCRLLARRIDGIFSSPFQQGEIGPDLFRHACNLASWDWFRNTARRSTRRCTG